MRNLEADAINTMKVTMDEADLRQEALHKLFGLTHRRKLVPGARGLQQITQGAELRKSVPAFDGLREAYIAYTGDTDLLHVGQHRVTQVGTPDFQSALANTINNLLMKDYAGDEVYRWRDRVTSFTSPENFKPQERGRIRYVGDLPDVGEDAPYDEIVSHGDEGISYSINQKGATLTITRRMLLADNVGAIKRLVEQLGRAAWRTLAKRVWSKLINNDIYGADGLPIFNAAHSNVGSAALSVTSLTAARNALFAQTEAGSNERLGLGSGQLLLAIPIELEVTALPLNSAERIAAADAANPWYQRFGPNAEGIFANPLFAEASADWYLFDISGKAGIIELAFLFGKQAPEVIVANNPGEGQGFTQDRITYKLRHEYECAISDFRALYKSVVA